jgi:hypothetical protein
MFCVSLSKCLWKSVLEESRLGFEAATGVSEASELPGFDVSPAQGDQRTWPFLKRCLPQLRLLPHPSRSLKSKNSLSRPDGSRNT